MCYRYTSGVLKMVRAIGFEPIQTYFYAVSLQLTLLSEARTRMKKTNRRCFARLNYTAVLSPQQQTLNLSLRLKRVAPHKTHEISRLQAGSVLNGRRREN